MPNAIEIKAENWKMPHSSCCPTGSIAGWDFIYRYPDVIANLPNRSNGSIVGLPLIASEKDEGVDGIGQWTGVHELREALYQTQ